MSLWIKICANTTLEDALLSAEAGADAVGFVFARSPRRVTVDQVAAIVPGLPAELEKIGVFVDASLEEIATAVETCGLTGVQLCSFHFDAPRELTAALRARFGPKLRLLRVVHFNGAVAGETQPDHDSTVDAVLVDSRSANAPGGTGVAFDWNLAAATLFQNPNARQRLIAAGGLAPENVAEAIRILRPWGVDVASGVESAPGLKDAARLRAFIANARAAFQG